MDGSLPGSSIHGILQEKVLERGAIAFSKFFFFFVDSPQAKLNILNVLTTPRDNNLNLYQMEKGSLPQRDKSAKVFARTFCK